MKRMRKLVVLLLLSNRCDVTINFLWLFLTVSCFYINCFIAKEHHITYTSTIHFTIHRYMFTLGILQNILYHIMNKI